MLAREIVTMRVWTSPSRGDHCSARGVRRLPEARDPADRGRDRRAVGHPYPDKEIRHGRDGTRVRPVRGSRVLRRAHAGERRWAGAEHAGMTALSRMRPQRFAVGHDGDLPAQPGRAQFICCSSSRSTWSNGGQPVVTGTKTACFALTEPEAGSDVRRSARVRSRMATGGGSMATSTTSPMPPRPIHRRRLRRDGRREAGRWRDHRVPGARRPVPARADNGTSPTPTPGSSSSRTPGCPTITSWARWASASSRPWSSSTRAAYIGAQALGLAEFCLDAATTHVQTRTAFGKPLAAFQGASFPLAKSKVDIEAMRWLIYHLAWAVDEGQNPMLDASIVKYYTTEQAYTVADRCPQVFGGMGLMKSGRSSVLRHCGCCAWSRAPRRSSCW